jgi:uncharacterized protein YabE (DUF348 family)
MKSWPSVLLALFLLLLAASCQRAVIATILADGEVYQFTTSRQIPAELLSEADVTLGANDRVLYLGSSVPPDQSLPEAEAYTLVVRRAVMLTLVTSGETRTIQTSAQTVGLALTEAGFMLSAADQLDPPAGTPITAPLTVTYRPAQTLTITVDGKQIQVHSVASTVGQALAETGLALTGLDYAVPSESEPLPMDGKIRLVRVIESVVLTQKHLPYSTRTELSADLEIDQQALLQGGEPGLAIARVRSRSEDGAQVSQQAESESIVLPPQDRILGIGTKIVIRTIMVDGVAIEYWRALEVYATYYIPCDANNDCHYGTSIGTPVRRGEVAMVIPWWKLFAHERLYVPGYGFATIEDTNGANTSAYWGTYWIDVGYAQTDSVDWANKYLTIYFLTPVAANVADTYILP